MVKVFDVERERVGYKVAGGLPNGTFADADQPTTRQEGDTLSVRPRPLHVMRWSNTWRIFMVYKEEFRGLVPRLDSQLRWEQPVLAP